jgi:hypothetical protein
MAETKDWEEEKFSELFDDEIRVLQRRRLHDSDCTVADLEGTLNALYVLEGNNLEGRSRVHEIAISASIAAYEKFIDEWKKELKNEKS